MSMSMIYHLSEQDDYFFELIYFEFDENQTLKNVIKKQMFLFKLDR
jgi:hypothetical protein